jgi:hypothetical protein
MFEYGRMAKLMPWTRLGQAAGGGTLGWLHSGGDPGEAAKSAFWMGLGPDIGRGLQAARQWWGQTIPGRLAQYLQQKMPGGPGTIPGGGAGYGGGTAAPTAPPTVGGPGAQTQTMTVGPPPGFTGTPPPPGAPPFPGAPPGAAPTAVGQPWWRAWTMPFTQQIPSAMEVWRGRAAPPKLEPGRTFEGPGEVITPKKLTPTTGEALPSAERPAIEAGTPPVAPRQLAAAPGGILPGGTSYIPPPQRPLPTYYSQLPVTGAPTPPATFGGLQLGELGGITPRGEQTVTGVKRPNITKNDETTGQFRKLTPAEEEQYHQDWLAQRTGAGRTAATVTPTPVQPTIPAPLFLGRGGIRGRVPAPSPPRGGR